MLKLLWLSDYGRNVNTGYATVSRNLIRQLKEIYGNKLVIDVVAINYFDEQYWEYDETVLVTSAMLGPGGRANPASEAERHKFGLLHFLWKYRNQEYDGVFMLQDLGVLAPAVANMRKIDEEKRKFKLPVIPKIIYFPVDGPIQTEVLNAEFDEEKYKQLPANEKHLFSKYIRPLDALTYFTKAVTFTEYGFNQVLRQTKPEMQRNISCRLRIIPHGIDQLGFYPVQDHIKAHYRPILFQKNADKFIVGVINRNQPRKEIPTAISGFIEAKKNWPPGLPPPFLYLHMTPVDSEGWNLPVLMAQTNLVEGVDYMYSKGEVDILTLNHIYNCIDVYLSTASGGGWELTVTEAMACRVPCIIPAHTSLKEQGADGERAWMLDELLPVCNHTENIWRKGCHFDQVAEMIIEVAIAKRDNESIYQARINSAYKWATGLNWEDIAQQWSRIFEEIF